MLELFLPYPPSVNTYWGFQGSHRYLTAKAKFFKSAVRSRFLETKHKGFGNKKLFVSIYLHAPDRRRRDIDNHVKSLLDACTQANIMDDDSQVDRLLVIREPIVKHGLCRVRIELIDSLPPV